MSLFSGIGIDVSNHHIRFAEVSLFGSVSNLHEIELPEGLVEDEKIIKPKELKAFVQKQLRQSPYKGRQLKTTLLIPESHVFSSSFILDSSLKGDRLRHKAIQNAQKQIPIPHEDAFVDVSQGAKEEGGTRTTVYFVKKDVLRPLVSVFDEKMFRIVAMEANTKSLWRLFTRHGQKNLRNKDAKKLMGIVDIGHSWATVSLYTPAGSNLYSRTIAYHGSTKAKQLSKDVVDRIIETIKESVLYFSKKNAYVEVFLFGGVEAADDAFLNPIIEQEDAKIGFYHMGDVVQMSGRNKVDIQTFGAAIGSALRSEFSWQYSYQHNFLTSFYEETQTNT